MWHRFSTALVALVLVVTACSGESATTQPTDPPRDGFPVTVETPTGAVTIAAPPKRIVSLSPTSTEVLFAIGAGDQVVAVDSLSNYPQAAPTTELSAFTPSVEAISEYLPDLVFISFDPGGVVDGLSALDIAVIVHPTAVSLADAYDQWMQTGAATGHLAEAEAVVAATKDAIDEIATEVADAGAGSSYFYEIDDLLYTTTSSSFIGQVIAVTGMTNIADGAPDPDGYGFPQLSAEFIVEANPTLILLADAMCCGQSLETVSERPGWGSMDAVVHGRVVTLDDDIASRWSPRIVTLLEAVADTVRATAAGEDS
ncbi:MAG: ABC transporter substrate-binding protein [Acidimicrobiia bacterium]